MSLNTLWFIVIGVLFTGFFFLEGFDYGVGILLPFLGKNDTERRMIINTIGPFWDGNEVWLLMAGGAMFAAFPNWYATMFSGFYLALALMLIALSVRGVAFEFRSKVKGPRWRALWDWLAFAGSLVPALLWGVALANIVRGVPINEKMQYVGGFSNLLNPCALLAGLVSLAVFTLHGAGFLTLRTTDKVLERAERMANRLWLLVVVLVFLLVGASYLATDIFRRLGVNPGISATGAGLSFLVVGWFVRNKPHGWGLRDDGSRHRADRYHHFPWVLPVGDGVQSRSEVQPRHLQHVVEPIHHEGDENRGPHLRAHCVDLPGLELLDLPGSGDRAVVEVLVLLEEQLAG
jgi:cytochrome d ubiquinol oxidase subunit II